MRTKFLSIGLSLVLAVGLCTMSTWAQSDDSVGLSVVPAIIDQPLTPGVSTTVSIQVTNISQQPLPIQVATRPLAPLDPLTDTAARDRYDASSWITPLSPELVLAPEESKSVQFSVRPADNAGPGGHYALIVFRALTSQPDSDNSTAQVNPEVAVTALLSVPGATTEQLEQKLSQPTLWQIWPPAEVGFDLVNRGNVHVLPQSSLSFVPIVGGSSHTVAVSARLVLPGTTSRFAAGWPRLEWGLYKVKLSTSYGTPLKQIESTSAWFFVPPPLWLQAVILGLLWVAVYGLKRLANKVGPIRHRRRRLAADPKQVKDRGASADELDYLSRDSDARDISRKRRN